jgi:hypothetical protein
MSSRSTKVTAALIAVTAGDETNLVACKVAADLYNIPTRIARVRNVELREHPKLIGEEGFRATHVIFPEQTVTDYLLKLIEFPEALQVLEFADGRASLIAVRAFAGGLASGPTNAYRLIKEAFGKSGGQDLEAQLRLEARLQGEAGRTPDFRDAVEAFKAKRPPVFGRGG